MLGRKLQIFNCGANHNHLEKDKQCEFTCGDFGKSCAKFVRILFLRNCDCFSLAIREFLINVSLVYFQAKTQRST